MVSNAAMRAGLYHPGLFDLPWTAPFLWIAWLAVAGRFPEPRWNEEPSLDWRESRLGAVLTVILALAAPLLHLGVVHLHGATPEITRLRVPLTLATTLAVALLTIFRQVGHLMRVESRVAAREAERDAAEKARVQVEERYRGLVQSMSAVVWRLDPATLRLTFVSDQAEALLGYPVAAWTEEPDFWARHLHPDDRDRAETLRRDAIAAGHTHEFQYRMLRADGETVWVSDNVRVISGPDGGAEVVGVLVDVTDQKRLEHNLRQSQKMEAVGLLAGGIAHDFNNLLGVISGYAELARRGLAPGHAAIPRVEEIARAADRASALTRQLLAFGRRQVLQPTVLDLNDVLGGVASMLGRLISEDIQLVANPQTGLGRVRADAGQVEQVVMNLVINARDAMPAGGRLVIATQDVELDAVYVRTHPDARPGRYVMLSVSDTGHGMDAGTMSRIFEPFFTTKEEGKGTGLGLATVYGIVRQSGGTMDVYSEPGRGAVFRVYLPRVDDEVAREAAAEPVAPPRGTGTVLVVEDSESLRLLVRELLEDAGYTVLDAEAPDEALQLLQAATAPIDVVLTDMVMPRMGGRELASRVAHVHPGARVVFMSGYADDAAGRDATLEPGSLFLQKPFTLDALLRMVRRAIEAPPPAPEPPTT